VIDFGFWIDARNPSRWRTEPGRHIATILDRVERIEALGWDEVWLSEQIFGRDGESAASLPLCAAVAARTERIRIGTGVLPLPFLNPVRVAEDAGTLDLLSTGRFQLGVGLGPRSARPPGADETLRDRGPRADEAIQIIRRLLSGERLDFEGSYFRYEGLEVHPLPMQQPLPLGVGGASEAAARRAGELADGWIGVGPIAEWVGEMKRSAESAGRNPELLGIAGGLPRLLVARDPEKRWREARDHFDYQFEVYRDWFRELGWAEPRRDAAPPTMNSEQASEAIRRYADLNQITRFLSFGVPPGLPDLWAEEHLELMAREVIPAFR
jgi:alkanesulfonate monooxygenase SsuD/methylene tetrahydromethanopterin reductase-like flavin-dependent oxidoreductase (luciferase family)